VHPIATGYTRLAGPAPPKTGQTPGRSLGGCDSANPSWRHCTASSAYLRAITHEILISLVEIS